VTRIANFGLRISNLYGRATHRLNSKSDIRNSRSNVVDGEFLSKLDRLSLVLGRDLLSGLMGEHNALRRTSGIEFADHRQYSPGDDLRRVDWNAYARLGTLHIRQSQAEHDTVLYLLVDASPSMEYGEPSKFLVARRLAAAFGYIALSHLDAVVVSAPGSDEGRGAGGEGRRVSAWEPGSTPPPQEDIALSTQHSALSTIKGRAEAGSLFRYLQAIQARSIASFDNVLSGWSARRGQGRIAIVISDLLLDGYQEGVRQLVGAGFQVMVLHVLSPDELRPSEMGEVELTDSETGKRLEIHLGEASIAEYRRRLDAWLAESEAWCRANGAHYLLVQSDWEVERVLLDTMRRHGVTV
jgi:uncharacterized protein DUF58